MVSATAFGSDLIPFGSLSMAPSPSWTMSDRLRRVGLDVGVEQEPHVGFVLLEVDVLTRAELDLIANTRVVGDLCLDGCRFSRGIAGVVHLVGEVAERACHARDRLVQLDSSRLVGLQLLGVTWLGCTEVLLVLERVLRRLDPLADGADLLQRLV
jgi:hypothetical protein